MPKYPVLGPVLQGGVILTSGEIELEEKQAVRLLELGVIGEEITKAEVPLEKMKLQELKDHAKKHNIDLGEANGKEEVLAAILEAGDSNGNGGAS